VIVEESAWAARLAATLLGVFGALALALAAIGIYGVMSYEVRQRTREIGIRMVLGARPQDVLRHVLARGMFLVAIGAGVGVVGGLILRAALAELLFGIGAFDLVAFGGAAAILVGVALVAAWLPARRATRIQPVVALRME
jgi:ABC-type antimicrobial peptide transport system permease subunit